MRGQRQDRPQNRQQQSAEQKCHKANREPASPAPVETFVVIESEGRKHNCGKQRKGQRQMCGEAVLADVSPLRQA